MGHHLIVLGDVEEMWEKRPATILNSYPHTFALEAAFHRSERYLRIWGNHDEDWRYEDQVEELLQPVYGGPKLAVQESTRLHVYDGDEHLGYPFLAHGYQGTVASDRYAFLSRFFVRYFYQP